MRTLVLLLACAITASLANTAGRRFQLVFMENLVEAPTDDPLEVHVSNIQSVSATVTVSSPMTSCPSQTLTVSANSATRFTVCWWMRLVNYDYWPSYKTVLVESTQDVMVYGYNKELYSADGFYAIPTDELAETYYLAAYDKANLATQFAISATSDVDIQVQLPDTDALPVEVNYQGLRYTNGQRYTMRLAQYETYLAQSRGDISGARVTASKPIAVFSGNIRNKQGSESRDHLVAQLSPVGDWGTEFYTAPVPRTENFGDIMRIFGQKSNTAFTIRFNSGAISSFTLNNPGDYQEFSITGPVAVTAQNSNRPLQIIQMVRSQAAKRIDDVADPAMFLLVPRSQWLAEYISPALRYSRDGNAYAKNFALITVPNSQRTGLRINGNTLSAQWIDVNGISIAWIAVGSNNNRFTHTNGQSFMVNVYGASDRESYAFALGANLANSGCQESLSILGDGRDNDCDNNIDEEECDGIDNDNDGLIDEDCESVSVEAFGNSYMIMFMENNVDDNPNAESFLEIYMSNVDSTSTVQYSIFSEEGWLNGSIINDDVVIIDQLSANLRQVGNGVQNKGIRIQADGDIIVYGINKQTWSTDGFLAFPTDVVGTEYYTAHYWPGTDLNEFAIAAIATDGPTQVSVTMPQNVNPNSGNVQSSGRFNGQTIAAGATRTFSISPIETAQIQGVSADDNLNGAYITSNKPVSVFSGNVRARVDPVGESSRDHLVHQLAPVSTWGRSFVTTPAPRDNNRGDKFTVTASQPSTTFSKNVYMENGDSTSESFTLDTAGSTRTFDIASDAYANIQSDKPIQVVQYVKTSANRRSDNADPAMMLYPPVEQWSRNYAFVTPRTGQRDPNQQGQFLSFDNYIMIAIDTNQRNGLRLDNNAITPVRNWVQLQGTTYSATYIRVNPGRHVLSHVDNAVNFQAIMYGRADRESFGLPLGMRLVARACEPTTMNEGDGIDNDCDGSVDEELCNSIDDDADGVVDEDCGAGLSSGTSFYLTYMENTVESPRDFDLELYVAVVGSQPALVNVRAPLVDQPVYNSMIEVQPGKVQGYGFTWAMRNEGQGVSGKTIYVRANSEVVVYGVNKELFSNDGFLVYPENSLGTNYYTVSWSPSTLATEFAVVGTLDNTQVSITLPSGRSNIAVQYNGNTFGSGASFNVLLNRFQVYQGQSDGDLTGTRISSSQRIAVFSGNVRTLIDLSNSRDHLVQQMLPTTSYGTEYNLVPFPDRTVGDVIRVIAANGNTQVSITGENTRTLQAGQYFQYDLASNNRVRLSSNNPIQVVQFAKSQDGRNNPEQGDPAMFVVPSVTNYVSTATFITPVYSGGNTPGSDYTNYLTVIINNGQQGNLRLNGASINEVWTPVSNTGYVTATILIPSGQAHTLTTTSGANFYGRLYGRADRETYAFAVGMRF